MVITRDKNPYSMVTINLDSINGIGSYNLNDSLHGFWASYLFNNTHTRGTFITDSLHTGIIVITNIDTVMRLVSGTITFEAFDGNKTVHLTEGVFTDQYSTN